MPTKLLLGVLRTAILQVPFAFDWTAPKSAGANRVMMADRTATNHGDEGVNAAYADGHTAFPAEFLWILTIYLVVHRRPGS